MPTAPGAGAAATAAGDDRERAAMTKKKSGGSSPRMMHTKVKKKAGTIKESSRRWLQRQLNDPYVARAKAEGYRSRAAYKLLEIDEKHHLLGPGKLVIDLGCAPGGWCQVAAAKTGSRDDDLKVVGIDYLPVDPVPGAAILEMDFLDDDAPDRLIGTLGERPDLVLSDMAAPTTGHKRTDHLRTMHLAEVAADFAVNVLKPGGHFLTKTFQGGTENDLLTMLKQRFATVHHVKPPASRGESVELFLLAKNFRG